MYVVIIIFNLIKQSEKMQNEEQNLFKASQKSPFLIIMLKFVFG